MSTRDFRYPKEKTTPQWTSILHLAAKWEFESIKLLAINNLTAYAAPVDKIVLGRRYGIDKWLPDAYNAVCIRNEPLTVEEGMKLGVEDTIKISAARQAYGFSKSRFEKKHLSQDLGDIFELDGSSDVQLVKAINDQNKAIDLLESKLSVTEATLLMLSPIPIGTCCVDYYLYNFSNGPGCGDCCARHSESEETKAHRREREREEEKEQRLKDLKHRHQQRQRHLAAKLERVSLFRK